MPVLSVFFAVSLFLSLLFMQNQRVLEVNAVVGEAAAISGNMRVYRNAVVDYAQANTGVTGPVTDASLRLPAWFNHMPAVCNYVAGGKSYVYYKPAQPELAQMILRSSRHSILTGIKGADGMLYNPIYGATRISLPEAIPAGSVVYASG